MVEWFSKEAITICFYLPSKFCKFLKVKYLEKYTVLNTKIGNGKVG